MVEISFCDEVSIGQFGKVNLLGLNPGDALAVPRVPYNLFSTLVIQIFFGPGESTEGLAFTIRQNDLNGSSCFEESYPIANLNREDSDHDFSLFFVQPIAWTIRTFGVVKFTVVSCKNELGSRVFDVVKGEAPVSALIAPITSSGVITESKGFALDAILKSANKALIFIDQFLKYDDLTDLLSVVPAGIAVRVLTGLRSRDEYLSKRSALDSLSQRVEVKFSKRFHDRYVIVNETEYFHFGYSLKDLWTGRVSRYAKLYRKDEIDDLRDICEAEWRTAEVL